MMKREKIVDELLRLTADYRHVYDGGYAEVRGIRDWARTLDSESRQFLWDRLLESVEMQESRLWGVAIAVLVEEHPDEIAKRLNDLLTLQKGSDEWENEIMFSLLLLVYRPAADKCFKYIEEGLLNRRDGVLRLLAASCRVDPDECITLSSNFFGCILQTVESDEEYASIIPTFVRHFLDVDERLVGQLVERTKTVDADAAKRLAALLEDYFTKPWNVREFGEAKVEALRKQIQAAKVS